MLVEKMFEAVIAFIHSLYPGKETIPLHEPCFAGREKEYLAEAIDSTFVSSVGAFVERLEQTICVLTGAKYAVATVNGTSALHAALITGGVLPGDEVITQPLTFVATANAISYCGALPILLDVDAATLGLSADALEAFCQRHTTVKDGACFNKQTKRRIAACVPMHAFGHPCQIDRIAEICRHHHLLLVEDAAESLGSTYHGKHTGTFGDFGIFSFNGNKIVTSGGGGMIVTDNADAARLAKHLTTTAKVPHPWQYEHDRLGYNYRMPNLNAALLCAQLEQLEKILAKKRELAARYAAFFQAAPDMKFIAEPPGAHANFWLNTILLPDQTQRDDFLAQCHRAGILCRPAWNLLHTLPMYRECQRDSLENASCLAERLVNLPSSVRT
ncbi:MAG: LegC family aminotransferase [Thermodesulfobacteriota bacterium]